ncbi:hypothetical protein ACUN24_20865 [Pedobacter sp. WC2501]|uniref:hypothetical protein n=1 Tax=Pedobacter sp. WC2501 TaxID=3461400 RepID=UPI004045C7E3
MKNQQNKNRMVRNIIIILACLIAVSNTPPIQFFNLDRYHYQNADASFTYTEFPGKSLDPEVGMTRWQRLKTLNPNNPNRTSTAHLQLIR